MNSFIFKDAAIVQLPNVSMHFVEQANMVSFKHILFCGCWFLANALYSQSQSDSCYYEFDTITKRNIYSITDIEPSFPDGAEEMKDFINNNIEYVDPTNGEIAWKIKADEVNWNNLHNKHDEWK